MGGRYYYCPIFTDDKTEAPDHTASRQASNPQPRALLTVTLVSQMPQFLKQTNKNTRILPCNPAKGVGWIGAPRQCPAPTTKRVTTFSISQQVGLEHLHTQHCPNCLTGMFRIITTNSVVGTINNPRDLEKGEDLKQRVCFGNLPKVAS